MFLPVRWDHFWIDFKWQFLGSLCWLRLVEFGGGFAFDGDLRGWWSRPVGWGELGCWSLGSLAVDFSCDPVAGDFSGVIGVMIGVMIGVIVVRDGDFNPLMKMVYIRW